MVNPETAKMTLINEIDSIPDQMLIEIPDFVRF